MQHLQLTVFERAEGTCHGYSISFVSMPIKDVTENRVRKAICVGPRQALTSNQDLWVFGSIQQARNCPRDSTFVEKDEVSPAILLNHFQLLQGPNPILLPDQFAGILTPVPFPDSGRKPNAQSFLSLGNLS